LRNPAINLIQFLILKQFTNTIVIIKKSRKLDTLQKVKESWTTFKYDDKGNVIMEVDSNVMRTGSGARIIPVHNVSLTGNTRTFIYYNFDKAGNWLEKKELINDVLYRTNKREIEYY
jgi:hypothetical protein